VHVAKGRVARPKRETLGLRVCNLRIMTSRWDETWHRLRVWTSGQGPSERLAAQVLLSEGFSRLDPAHPLGGPDAKRDALAWRDGSAWIMAAYFPRAQRPFTEIRAKFISDCEGIESNGAAGIAFVTNQEISRAERDQLCALTEHSVELFHLERLTAILDQPSMLLVRAQFLGIAPGEGEDADNWTGTYEAPEMPDGWPRIWTPPQDTESHMHFEEDPDDYFWKYPRVCVCGEVFTDPVTEHEGFQGSWGDGREYLEGAIPKGITEEDLFNPIVWHWLNLLWDVGEEEGGESFSAFEAREEWFKDDRSRREFVQAMEAAQAEFDTHHPEHARTLRWRKPWT
jgi:hypothetical protein